MINFFQVQLQDQFDSLLPIVLAALNQIRIQFLNSTVAPTLMELNLAVPSSLGLVLQSCKESLAEGITTEVTPDPQTSYFVLQLLATQPEALRILLHSKGKTGETLLLQFFLISF